jgi:hypothetical protein
MFMLMLGKPGEVGGFANGAELTECAPLLCPFRALELPGLDRDVSGEWMFVKVMVTANGSPA